MGASLGLETATGWEQAGLDCDSRGPHLLRGLEPGTMEQLTEWS